MDIEQYRKKVSSDGYIEGGSEAHLFMHGAARSAQRADAGTKLHRTHFLSPLSYRKAARASINYLSTIGCAGKSIYTSFIDSPNFGHIGIVSYTRSKGKAPEKRGVPF